MGGTDGMVDGTVIVKRIELWNWLKALKHIQVIRKAHKLNPTAAEYDKLLDAFISYVHGNLIESGIPPEEIV